MSLLQARGLHLRLGQRQILDDLSLVIEAGQRVALLGQNGAGKSTLFDILCGLRAPDAGWVELDGQPILQMERVAVARRLAMVPQIETLPDDLLVIEAVLMGRAAHQSGFGLADDQDLEVAEQALREMDLVGLDGREVGTLSGGERQRVLIARALAQRPDMLLLDEPTSALDMGHALYVAHLCQRLADKGLAVLSTVHDINQAPLFAERVLVLHQGRLAIDDTVDQALDPDRLRDCFEVDLVRGELAGRPVLVPR